MRLTKTVKVVAVLAAAVISAALPAEADLIMTLGLGNNPGLAPGTTGPYGTVDIALAGGGTEATVTLTAAAGYTIIDSSALALDLASAATVVNGLSGVALTSYTGTGANGMGAAAKAINTGNQNVDGWGNFNLTIDLEDGFGRGATSMSLTLEKTSGTWASAGDVLLLNGPGGLSGYDVTGHFASIADLGTTTGYAVPEPTTVLAGALLLLPFGASTLRILRRNRTA
jgi:hypothetical protein